jgi:hypothetical protein
MANLLIRCSPHSQGRRLALGCHHRRNPARSKWQVSCSRPFHSSRVHLQVFICLNLNGKFLFLCTFCQRKTLMIGPDSARTIRSVQRRAFLFVTRVGSQGSLTPVGITDVPNSLDGHPVNCCDSNLSLSGRLCLRVHRTVRHNSNPLLSAAHCG